VARCGRLGRFQLSHSSVCDHTSLVPRGCRAHGLCGPMCLCVACTSVRARVCVLFGYYSVVRLVSPRRRLASRSPHHLPSRVHGAILRPTVPADFTLRLLAPSARPSRASPPRSRALSRPVQTLSHRPIRAVKVFHIARDQSRFRSHVPVLGLKLRARIVLVAHPARRALTTTTRARSHNPPIIHPSASESITRTPPRAAPTRGAIASVVIVAFVPLRDASIRSCDQYTRLKMTNTRSNRDDGQTSRWIDVDAPGGGRGDGLSDARSIDRRATRAADDDDGARRVRERANGSIRRARVCRIGR
jgi:hypothetical protein